jgi:hypothetical protein
MAVISREYERWNSLALPSPGRVAAALKQFLVENQRWSIDQITRSIMNRFASDMNPADEPWVWLPYLARYARGPLDKFSRPKARTEGESQRELVERKLAEDRERRKLSH